MDWNTAVGWARLLAADGKQMAARADKQDATRRRGCCEDGLSKISLSQDFQGVSRTHDGYFALARGRHDIAIRRYERGIVGSRGTDPRAIDHVARVSLHRRQD